MTASGIRIGRVALAVTVCLVILAISSHFYHPVMVWTHQGEWCAKFNADGELVTVLYGKICQNPDGVKS